MLASVPRDAYGHVRLADVPIGAVLRDAIRDAARRDRRRHDRSEQGHRLRAALREAGTVRRRVYPHAGIRCGPLLAARRERRADRALGRTRHAGQPRRAARSGDRTGADPLGRRHDRRLRGRTQVHDPARALRLLVEPKLSRAWRRTAHQSFGRTLPGSSSSSAAGKNHAGRQRGAGRKLRARSGSRS